MDRSTQVNFTIANDGRRQLRHSRTASASVLARCAPTSLQATATAAPKNAKRRPKSINLSSEIYHKSRFVYNADGVATACRGVGFGSAPNTDAVLNSVAYSREKTPHFTSTSHSSLSTNATAAYGGGYNRNFYTKQVRTQESPPYEYGYASTRCCCCDHERNSSSDSLRDFAPTSEELSWRRLHMSRAKLKATATTSELLSGFAMVAMVELQINDQTLVPDWLFVMFAICTTILVAVHIFALMISTYILPNIEAIAKLDVCEIVDESPHERMRTFIELAWVFSTVLGLFLFLVEVAILCWVKFWDTSITAAIAATVIVIPVLIIFVLFAVHFYHTLVVHRYDTSVSDIEKLEDMRKQLDQVNTTQV